MDEENTGRPPEEQAGPPEESGETPTGAETAPGIPPTPPSPPSAAEDATRVMPGEDAEDATRVMPGDDAAATRVMGAGGAAPPPPPRPQPTLVMSSGRPPKEGSGSSTGWIVVIVILVALAAAAGTWYFLLRDQDTATPTPSPAPTAAAFDWVGAWAPTDGSGGGIVLQQSGGEYQVTVYDTMVRVLGSTTATMQGEDLTFKFETPESLAGIPGPYDISLSPGPGPDAAAMSVTGSNGTTIIMPLVRVPALVPVTPSSSPSPTASPSPTTSPSASPSPTTSPTQSAEAQQVIDGVDRIQAGIMTWSTNNNGLYPQPADVTEGGDVAQYVDPWPTNPYNGAPMKPGTGPGEYIYEQLNGGAGYQLTGYLSGGLTYTVP